MDKLSQDQLIALMSATVWVGLGDYLGDARETEAVNIARKIYREVAKKSAATKSSPEKP